MGKTLVYKFGKQKDKKLSPKEGIKTHILHAEANGGKVLLTIDKFPSTKHRDNIDEIIITVKSGVGLKSILLRRAIQNHRYIVMKMKKKWVGLQ